MNIIKPEDAIIGSVLASSVELNGSVLYSAGTPISQSLKNSLMKLDIDKISVNTIFNSRIDNHRLDIDNLNNFIYQGVKKLDIDNLMVCARSLVKSTVDSDYNAFLNTSYTVDEITYNHSLNVASLSLTCGIHLGMSIHVLKILTIGGLLHDIGKSRIDKEILSKPAKLTEEEFNQIKLHPQLGYGLIMTYKKVPSPVKDIILQHHENWDGSGYPQGLVGKEVSRLARIVHIADVYEALCARRSYKKPIPRRLVREIMEEGSGKQFDPFLLRSFLKSIPMYTVGEEVECDGKIGIVCDISNKDNPTIYYKHNYHKLTDFENIDNARQEYLSTHGTITSK